MKTKKRKEYEAPYLTVVTFKAESGFAQSTPMLGLCEDFGQETLEERNDGGNWGGNDGWF